MKRKSRTKTAAAYAFILPALVMIIVFIVIPVAASIVIMFYDYSVVGQARFIGYDNFIKAFRDKGFINAVRNTLIFVIVVPVIQILSLFIAFLLGRKTKSRAFFRTVFFIPSICSQVAVSITWGNLIQDGILDDLFLRLHLISKPLMLLGNKKTAIICLMLITIWQNAGYYMMIYLSGINNIPEELEEAARIDGAGGYEIIRYIYLPELRSVIWIASLHCLILVIGIFDIVYIITQGGPNEATMVISYYSYKKAFEDFQFGYAAAIGAFQAVITYILSLGIFTVYFRKRR